MGACLLLHSLKYYRISASLPGEFTFVKSGAYCSRNILSAYRKKRKKEGRKKWRKRERERGRKEWRKRKKAPNTEWYVSEGWIRLWSDTVSNKEVPWVPLSFASSHRHLMRRPHAWKKLLSGSSQPVCVTTREERFKLLENIKDKEVKREHTPHHLSGLRGWGDADTGIFAEPVAEKTWSLTQLFLYMKKEPPIFRDPGCWLKLV